MHTYTYVCTLIFVSSYIFMQRRVSYAYIYVQHQYYQYNTRMYYQSHLLRINIYWCTTNSCPAAAAVAVAGGVLHILCLHEYVACEQSGCPDIFMLTNEKKKITTKYQNSLALLGPSVKTSRSWIKLHCILLCAQHKQTLSTSNINTNTTHHTTLQWLCVATPCITLNFCCVALCCNL